MKNLFLLATEKPSRLSILNNGELNFGAEFISSSNAKAKHIYITNSEEIKEGDFVVENTTSPRPPYIGKIFYPKNDGTVTEEILKRDLLSVRFKGHYETLACKRRCKKIILTTDKDLIADGVQSIPDEFLEWFVKNTSCEEVEVDWVDFSLSYFIKIPKEEPKQDSVFKCTCLRPQVNCFSGMCSYCNRQIVKNLTTEDLKPKIVGEYQQELFNYLHDLGVTALQSEMQEIERIVLKNSNINALNFEIDALKRQIKVLKRHKDQIYNKIKELYNNQNITGFSKRAYAQCLDIVEQFKK